jgi:hypothetical protein
MNPTVPRCGLRLAQTLRPLRSESEFWPCPNPVSILFSARPQDTSSFTSLTVLKLCSTENWSGVLLMPSSMCNSVEREQQIIMVASEALISEPAPSLISPYPCYSKLRHGSLNTWNRPATAHNAPVISNRGAPRFYRMNRYRLHCYVVRTKLHQPALKSTVSAGLLRVRRPVQSHGG